MLGPFVTIDKFTHYSELVHKCYGWYLDIPTKPHVLIDEVLQRWLDL